MVKVTKATKTTKTTTKPQVSSLGRFKSSRGVIFTPKPRKSGYVSVSCNGKPHLIHVLMAIALGLPKRDDRTLSTT